MADNSEMMVKSSCNVTHVSRRTVKTESIFFSRITKLYRFLIPATSEKSVPSVYQLLQLSVQI